MIADEKVGAKGVKVKCKKCAHIIIVKPATADEPAEAAPPSTTDAPGAGFGDDMFGGSPFNEPTQAMSQSQLASLAASSADPGDAASGGLPPAAAPEAGADGGFGGMTTDGGPAPEGDGGFPAPEGDGGFPAPEGDGGFPAPEGDGGFPAPEGDGGFPAPEGDGGLPAPDASFGGMPTTVDGAADTGFPAPAGFDAPADGGFGGGGFGADAAAPSMSDLAGQAEGGSDLNLDAALGGEQPAAAPAPSSRPAGEKEWYVAVDESQIGPIDLHEIEARWDGLEVDEDSLAWKAGMQDWVPIAEIDELAYLVTERPQAKPSASAFSAATTGGGGVGVGAGVAAAAGAGLGPVAFGGETGGESSSDVSWTPSAASALSSLVQDELTATPAAADPGPAVAPGGDAGMPSFGASDLFGGGGNGGTDGAAAGAAAVAPAPAPAPAMPPVAPAADPFAGGGGAQWSMPKPESGGGGGLKPIHLAFGGMGLLAVGLIVVLAIVLTRPPQTVVADANNANTPPVVTPPDKPATPVVNPDEPPVPAVVPTTPTAKEPKRKRRRKGGGGGGGSDPLTDLVNDPPPRPAAARKVDKPVLGKNDIMSGVKKGMGAVMGCIKTARAKGELAPGRHTLVLEWTIQPSGKVSSPKLKGPSNVLGTSLPACFSRSMRKWSFPSSEKGAPVRNFPFGPFSIK